MAFIPLTETRSFEVKTYKIFSDKISFPLRLVFLSDLHEEHHGIANSELLHEIRTIQPDLILCGGDMIVGKGREHPSVAPLMAGLTAIAPVYFSNGNHETQLAAYEKGAWRLLREDLRRAGVRILNNQSAELTLKGNPLKITGLEIDLEKYRKFTHPVLSEKELTEKIGVCSSGQYTILLAHNPYFMNSYFKWGADLILSGHNHGGIMRLGGNRILVSPYGWPLPKYGYGLIERGPQNMIITSGLGEHTIPFRIHNPMEVVRIDLMPRKQNKVDLMPRERSGADSITQEQNRADFIRHGKIAGSKEGKSDGS